MANNQLHGLQIQSLHMALPQIDTPTIFHVTSTNRNNELYTEITSSRFEKETGSQLKDQEISDKIMSFTTLLCEALFRFSKPIDSMKLDLLISSSGQIYLIKANELIFNTANPESLRDMQRFSSIKRYEEEHSDSQSADDMLTPHPLQEKERKKVPHKFKIPLSKPVQNNSTAFLEMMAKTIQKTRKSTFLSEYFKGKSLNKSDNLLKKTTFKTTTTLDSNKDSTLDKLSTMTDLLSLIEKTRPRNWVKDHIKSSQSLLKAMTNKKSAYPSRRGSSCTPIPKELQSQVNLSNQTHYFKKSRVVYSMRELTPIKLSKRNTSMPKSYGNIRILRCQ
ncbi:hypothetical protein SteCoe_27959 [Stentor coeruleus]|uniref:Uncharacterized protein n=1 Tax=Stentor coeruleus TaxID=5963 RepID=A0A1R2B9V2_9CILI|nr:hypothetical protein SteCoe_27959 [Stentor coeruleus]